MQDNEVAVIFSRLLDKLAGRLSHNDIENVADLVNNRECGVALEIMCAQLYEYDVGIHECELAIVKDLSEFLATDVSSYRLRRAEK